MIFIWSAIKMPFFDFIQNQFQAPSMWIKVNKWNYLKNLSQEFKNSFFLASYEYLERLEGKNRKCLIFHVKYSKITMCFNRVIFGSAEISVDKVKVCYF